MKFYPGMPQAQIGGSRQPSAFGSGWNAEPLIITAQKAAVLAAHTKNRSISRARPVIIPSLDVS